MKTQRVFLGFVVIMLLFQILTLNFPKLSGDESLYLLVVEEFRKLISEGHFSLNPIIEYEGPVHFWYIGSLYGFLSRFPIEPAPWMVRIMPLLFFWVGAFFLYKELKNWVQDRAIGFLLILLASPMTLVYSRVTFPQSTLLGLFCLLLVEALRIFRGCGIRWFRIGVLAGITIDVHTTAFAGLAAIFFPAIPPAWVELRKSPLRIVKLLAPFAIFSYPVFKNFPPPVLGPEGAHNVFLEIRNFLNTVNGTQSYRYWLAWEPAPNFFLVLLLILILYLVASLLRETWESGKKWDRIVFQWCVLHLVASVGILIMCQRSRSLTHLGHERYFLSLIPGWGLILASALYRLADRIPQKLSWENARWVVGGFALIQFTRFSIPILAATPESDPFLIATRWLKEKCHPGSCIAYAENFWIYWPTRFYSRDSIDLNFFTYNWKGGQHYPPEGKRVAACLFRDSDLIFLGKYQEKLEVQGQRAGAPLVCYWDVDLRDFKRAS